MASAGSSPPGQNIDARAGAKLFTPFRLGAAVLPNRIVMAPMTRARAGPGNTPTMLSAQYYAQRASAGLIVTESSQISPMGLSLPTNPGIHTDAQMAGWKRVTDAVHAAGGRIALQLWHAGRATHSSMLPAGTRPIGPSALPAQGKAMTMGGWGEFEMPTVLDGAGIATIVHEFGDAAGRARTAGFDYVEIHGGNGFLINQFLFDGSNRRRDAYGGSPGNRSRFLVEVAEAVGRHWPDDRIGVRLAPNVSMLGMFDSNPKRTFAAAAAALDRLGLAYIHVIEGFSPATMPDGAIRCTWFRDHFSGALIANGGYDSFTAEAALAAGQADLISFGRPFLANPDLPARFRQGAAFNRLDVATVYGGGAEGYTDYPLLDEGGDPLVGDDDEGFATVGFSLNLERVLAVRDDRSDHATEH